MLELQAEKQIVMEYFLDKELLVNITEHLVCIHTITYIYTIWFIFLYLSCVNLHLYVEFVVYSCNICVLLQLVPKHTVLTQEEKEALLVRYKLKEENLARIQKTDIIARYFGLGPGKVWLFTHMKK